MSETGTREEDDECCKKKRKEKKRARRSPEKLVCGRGRVRKMAEG